MTFSRSSGDACGPIFIPPPLTFSHLAEFRAAFDRCDRAGLLRVDASRHCPRGTTVPGHWRIRMIVGRCFPRLIEAKSEVRNMSNITGVADGQVRSRIHVAVRRSVAIGALGAAVLLGGALPVEAVALPQQVIYMTNRIRQAVWDCQHGDVPAVRERVALVTERLNPRS
jgi:hypothetical protein